MRSLPDLEYAQLAPTRDYLQDIAKVIGKAQQQFRPPDVNSWNKGLLITSNGLSTQELGDDKQIFMDLRKGQVRGFGGCWQLGEIEPAQLLEELKSTTGRLIEAPEYTTQAVVYDQGQAKALSDVLSFAAEELAYLKPKTKLGVLSPVLLYPHHFDVSMVWFTHRQTAEETDDRQFTFGFSAGDSNIAEPYFYVTAYPEPAKFKTIILKHPAYWQSQGFSAAIINYSAIDSKNPEDELASFYRTFVDAQISQFIL